MKFVCFGIIFLVMISFVSAETYFYYEDKQIALKDNGVFLPVYVGIHRLNLEVKVLPFGQVVSNNNQRFDFVAKEKDGELHYFGERYYDANLGRFSSLDPVYGELSYAYGQNNPLKFFDPYGSEVQFEWEGTPLRYEEQSNIEQKMIDFLSSDDFVEQLGYNIVESEDIMVVRMSGSSGEQRHGGTVSGAMFNHNDNIMYVNVGVGGMLQFDEMNNLEPALMLYRTFAHELTHYIQHKNNLFPVYEEVMKTAKQDSQGVVSMNVETFIAYVEERIEMEKEAKNFEASLQNMFTEMGVMPDEFAFSYSSIVQSELRNEIKPFQDQLKEVRSMPPDAVIGVRIHQ